LIDTSNKERYTANARDLLKLNEFTSFHTIIKASFGIVGLRLGKRYLFF